MQVELIFFFFALIIQVKLVRSRDPDENRDHFLFAAKTVIDVDDDPYDTYNYYGEDEEEIVDSSSLPQQQLVKEYIPDLTQSLTDDIYAQHNLVEVEEVRIIPSFLEPSSTTSLLSSRYENIHRVILWYNPYCAHSQRFKFTFLQLAEQIQHGLQSSSDYLNDDVEFHAISCSAHNWLCKQYEIRTFPMVWVFRKHNTDSDDYQVLKDYTITGLIKALDLDFPSVTVKSDGNNDADVNNNIKKHNHLEKKQPEIVEDNKDDEVIDILGASNDIYKRTRNDVFHDAAISFMHSIRSLPSYEKDNNNKKEQDLEFLSEYFDLLYWSLPPSWKILAIINDVRQNMKDYHRLSQSSLLSTDEIDTTSMLWGSVQSQKDFALNGKEAEWTQSCKSHDNPYQCGLWNLFHIISIGVAERHKAVLGGRDRVSTEYAALTIMHFISNFLTIQCNTQSENGRTKCDEDSYQDDANQHWNKLLHLFKQDCGNHKKFDRCKHFKVQNNRNVHQYYSDVNHWRELPLWLWEKHNELNILALKKEKQQKGQDCCTKDEERKVVYPSLEDCPNCLLHNGKWDREEVYNFLKTQYWPSGIHNFRYVVLDVKDQNKDKEKKTVLRLFTHAKVILGVIFLCWYGWTHRMKKSQNSNFGMRKNHHD